MLPDFFGGGEKSSGSKQKSTISVSIIVNLATKLSSVTKQVGQAIKKLMIRYAYSII